MTIAHESEHRSSAGKAGRRATYAASALALFWLAGPAEAQVPPFSASCPGRIDVAADAGGRITINGQLARVQPFDDRSYEARLGRIIVSVTVGPGGRLAVSYRTRGVGDTLCRVKPPRMEPPREGRDGPMGQMGQMAAVCRDRAAAEFRVRRSEIVTNMPFRDGRRFVVPGSFRDRGQPSAFACTFDATGRLLSVR